RRRYRAVRREVLSGAAGGRDGRDLGARGILRGRAADARRPAAAHGVRPAPRTAGVALRRDEAGRRPGGGRPRPPTAAPRPAALRSLGPGRVPVAAAL